MLIAKRSAGDEVVQENSFIDVLQSPKPLEIFSD